MMSSWNPKGKVSSHFDNLVFALFPTLPLYRDAFSFFLSCALSLFPNFPTKAHVADSLCPQGASLPEAWEGAVRVRMSLGMRQGRRQGEESQSEAGGPTGGDTQQGSPHPSLLPSVHYLRGMTDNVGLQGIWEGKTETCDRVDIRTEAPLYMHWTGWSEAEVTDGRLRARPERGTWNQGGGSRVSGASPERWGDSARDRLRPACPGDRSVLPQ